MEDLRLHAPAALRNRDAILDIVQAHFPATGLILEIASGSGEHCVHFAEKLRNHAIQPSDPSPRARASIDAWIATAGLPNVKAAIDLDSSHRDWPVKAASAIICINMIHISPWSATEGLFAGAARILPPGAPLLLYGPYKRDGAHTSKSNEDFDRALRHENPEWGVRDLERVAEIAGLKGFSAPAVFEMPANNLTLLFHLPQGG
ncbi:DUF938 domain-containing protein [Methylocapsa acidiphila]|nr:DUF938 domain-containing protein [Methylocapsa acidiphila]